MKLRLLIALSLLTSFASAQERHLVPQKTFDAIAAEYSGERAKENTRHIIQYHRIQGSPMMTEVAEKVVLAALKAEGIESSIEQFLSDGKTKYGTLISPVGWQMNGGELWIEGVGSDKAFTPIRLCRYEDAPMCVATYSKGGTWSGDLVEVGTGTKPEHYQGKDVRGKVLLASGYAGDVVREGVLKHGAIGAVIYPKADDRPDKPYMVRYNGVWPRAEELEKTSGGFMISAAQYAQIQSLMAKGPVRVRGSIDASFVPGKLTLVHAWIRGSEEPQREVILTAHLDHPKWSANDNASGSGGMLELARALNALVKSGKLPRPKRTIHFIWVPEYFGTAAWLLAHPEARACGNAPMDPRSNVEPWDESKKQPCVIANLNLDMIGENNQKLGSEFHATRTPDSVPSFLNALLGDVMEQTKEANLTAFTGTRGVWYARQSPLELGSDHEFFLGIGVPASMFWHYNDWTHHSSEDNLENVDPTEFLRVSTLAGAATWWMANTTDPYQWENAALMQDMEGLAESYRRATILLARLSKENQKQVGARIMRLPDQFPSVAKEHLKKGYPAAAVRWQTGDGVGPKRTTLMPVYDTAYEKMNEQDRAWWEAEEARVKTVPNGTFDLLLWEALNLMDGTRSTGHIAEILSAEFLVDVDPAWVEQLAGILQRQGLVEIK